MAAVRALVIGGSGIISSACVADALAAGVDVTVLNRGRSALRPPPDGVHVLHADVHDAVQLHSVLGSQEFDVVAEFVAFTPDQVAADIEFFTGRTGQYIFISSASAYQKPIARIPITESTPLRNPYWQYSRDKIACEDLLTSAFRDEGFPATIVRPSHTYDRTGVPLTGGWTVVDRMRRGLPVVVHGDGTSLWTLTHHSDFARAFTGLLGNPEAVGESVHITHDDALTWNQVYTAMATAAGVREPRFTYVASEAIGAVAPHWKDGLVGDKAHSLVFDNSKIKRLVPGFTATIPFAAGAREIVDWRDADPSRSATDPEVDTLIEKIISAYGVSS